MSKECITKTPGLEEGRSLTVHISHSAVEQGSTGTTWAPSTMWSLKIEALLRLFVLSQSKVSRTTIVLSPRRPVRQLMLKKNPPVVSRFAGGDVTAWQENRTLIRRDAPAASRQRWKRISSTDLRPPSGSLLGSRLAACPRSRHTALCKSSWHVH